jgi:hypothetical protein
MMVLADNQKMNALKPIHALMEKLDVKMVRVLQKVINVLRLQDAQ